MYSQNIFMLEGFILILIQMFEWISVMDTYSGLLKIHLPFMMLKNMTRKRQVTLMLLERTLFLD